ncbi:MAG TPA: cytochrome c peroxidase [Paucimonas sp.]|nr:cytochrome c peroxidase [Paucimonas sp.]
MTQARGKPAAALVFALSLAACGGGDDGVGSVGGAPLPSMGPPLTASAALGEKIFHDRSLSASGRLSCAVCHDPNNAHAQTDRRAVQLGGRNGDVPGFRAAPSLRYLVFNPEFAFTREGEPRGGYNRDGRSRTLAEQAEHPLLAAHEMANGSKHALVERLRHTDYAGQFRAVFGAAIFDRPDDAFERAAFALQQYQRQDERFRSFDSRYDRYLAGKATLTSTQLRGLALFNDPAKGNCAACHPSKPAAGAPPLFTDFGYANLGVPRNPAIRANADPRYYDLGLCGPARTDLAGNAALCGAFKVPTLRNVATRKVFFHNGVIASLREAVAFHVRRDTHPWEWYPLDADGFAGKFNDLPPAYRMHVETSRAPFDRLPGMAPALLDDEIDDVVQFLAALTDGYAAP